MQDAVSQSIKAWEVGDKEKWLLDWQTGHFQLVLLETFLMAQYSENGSC